MSPWDRDVVLFGKIIQYVLHGFICGAVRSNVQYLGSALHGPWSIIQNNSMPRSAVRLQEDCES